MAAIGRIVAGVHHVGSTSIPGMSAKPVIDIAVLLHDFDDGERCIEPLGKIGYEHRGLSEDIPGNRFFRRGDPRMYYLHMYTLDGPIGLKHFLFRDYPRRPPRRGHRIRGTQDSSREEVSKRPDILHASKSLVCGERTRKNCTRVWRTGPRFMNLDGIECIVFDFGFTVSSDLYFKRLDPEFLKVVDAFMAGGINRDLATDWGTGRQSSEDVAEYLSGKTGVPAATIIDELRAGCAELEFNRAVWDFADEQHNLGRKTALVTVNFDVFTDVIIPAHNLGGLFDAIVNSSDYGTGDKRVLWPIAFEVLGIDYGYGNSLLVEDSTEQVEIFRANGGQAHQYVGDEEFRIWLTSD